jgi:predicted PurR-regulated permease PerM
MLERIKNKISENSGLVNMVINLAILYLLFTVATGIKSVDKKITQVQQQTTGTIQPILDPKQTITDEQIQQMILNVLINKLQEAQGEIKR